VALPLPERRGQLAAILTSIEDYCTRNPDSGLVEIRLTLFDRPTIEADAEQLQTAFLNLLLNAAQASASGGRIDVTVSSENGRCRVAIADTGPGIPAETRDKIFEPFFTTKHRGTGLGLPTARRVIERHHGTIEFACPPGGGTTVTVTLPVNAK